MIAARNQQPGDCPGDEADDQQYDNECHHRKLTTNIAAFYATPGWPSAALSEPPVQPPLRGLGRGIGCRAGLADSSEVRYLSARLGFPDHD